MPSSVTHVEIFAEAPAALAEFYFRIDRGADVWHHPDDCHGDDPGTPTAGTPFRRLPPIPTPWPTASPRPGNESETSQSDRAEVS